MVRDVRRLLHRGPCTLSQVAVELGTDQEIARAALHFWVNRGDVVVETGRRVAGVGSGCGCGTCGAGAPAVGPAVYVWKD